MNKGWRDGLADKVPAVQALGPGFNLPVPMENCQQCVSTAPALRVGRYRQSEPWAHGSASLAE